MITFATIGGTRFNLHFGGHTKTVDAGFLRAIVEAVGPVSHEGGLESVMLNAIGGRLTETNVTSITGLRKFSRLDRGNAVGQVEIHS